MGREALVLGSVESTGNPRAVPAHCKIFATEDARHLAKKRLPQMIFDFIEGGAGREMGVVRNCAQFDDIRLQPRVMAGHSKLSLKTEILRHSFDMPFGIAPMGMCNLCHHKADYGIAAAAASKNIPACLSSAGSTSLEQMRNWAGDRMWFQLYFAQSAEATLAAVHRAQTAGYETLVFTVDVPEVSRRLRDLRNGFNLPFRMTPKAFVDFALHPQWSLSTLYHGIPAPRNFSTHSTQFDRKASRAGADWDFLKILRDAWKGALIVKGVTSASDATRIQSTGADGIYVSNHGARQLDSAPAAISLLPLIREAVGPDYPLFFDSGVRNGEDILKALALGADMVMLGRPTMYALAAAGPKGLTQLLDVLAHDLKLAMLQVGAAHISDLGPEHCFNRPNPK